MFKSLPGAQEKLVKKYHTRQGRKKADFYIVEGTRCCEEAIKFNVSAVQCALGSNNKALDELREHSFPLYSVDTAKFESLSLTENAQGIMLLMNKPVNAKPQLEDPFLLVLDGLQEPGNVGTILRTALAIGLKEVVFTKGSADAYNPKSVRAGMGAQFKLNISYVDSLKDLIDDERLQDRTFWLTTPRDGTSCYDDKFDLQNGVLVFGEEGGGIKDLHLGQKVTIPMPGEAESLNVAQAATLFLFEAVRRQIL